MEHRLIIGLTGEPGAGKDTLAGYLESAYGFTKYAFADTLRLEICTAFRPDKRANPAASINTATYELFKSGQDKAKASQLLALSNCRNKGFVDWYFETEAGILDRKAPYVPELLPRSPRWVMEKWGDYRLSDNPTCDVRTTPEALLVHSMRPSLIWKVVRTNNPRREQPSGHRTQTDYVPSDRWVQNLGDLARLQHEADLCMPGFVAKINTK